MVLIDLVTKQAVILKEERLSQRAAAKILVGSRNTIKKYIHEYRKIREDFTDLSVVKSAFSEVIIENFSYNIEKNVKQKLNDDMTVRLDISFKRNVQKRTNDRKNTIYEKNVCQYESHDTCLRLGHCHLLNII